MKNKTVKLKDIKEAKRPSPNYVVDVSYPLKFWGSDIEQQIDKVRKNYLGFEGGTGAGFGQRDMSITFGRRIGNAKNFAKAVSKLKRVKSVMMRDDNYEEVITHPAFKDTEYFIIKGKNPFVKGVKAKKAA